jgi:20S proteasome subunit alpha 3
MEAINHAPGALGILCQDGILLATEKRQTSKLLDVQRSEKLYQIDKHICCAIAGITADANTLIESAREAAQAHRARYSVPVPVEVLVRSLADVKQSYTQFGGLRPFGTSFIICGWDDHLGYQLYQSDPSGNFNAWIATAVGHNSSAALAVLRSDCKSDLSLHQATDLALKVFEKTVDASALSADKLDFATFKIDANSGEPVFTIVPEAELAETIETYKGQQR